MPMDKNAAPVVAMVLFPVSESKAVRERQSHLVLRHSRVQVHGSAGGDCEQLRKNLVAYLGGQVRVGLVGWLFRRFAGPRD